MKGHRISTDFSAPQRLQEVIVKDISAAAVDEILDDVIICEGNVTVRQVLREMWFWLEQQKATSV